MKLTFHAQKRINQRRFNEDLIKLAVKYGTVIYKAGAKFIFVRRKDIPKEIPKSIAEKIEGLIIVMNPNDGTIITVYKNKNGLRELKRKDKRHLKWSL